MAKTITLLGVEGCATCARLAEHVRQALAALPTDIALTEIVDPEQIMEYAAGGLPAVIVDGVVKAVRRVPSVEELSAWLS